jgi:CheY-like chemotaxis protein
VFVARIPQNLYILGESKKDAVTMKKILIVDDSPLIVNILRHILLRQGYYCVETYDGLECLEILKECTPDLILLDVMMEPMNGWDLLIAIKKDIRTKDIPVIILTAKTLGAEEIEQYGPLIRDYVNKPISAAELEEVVQRGLSVPPYDRTITHVSPIGMPRTYYADEQLSLPLH